MLTDTNKRRTALNSAILQRFNMYPTDIYPKEGSRLICLKNNTKLSTPIFNGMHTTLQKIHATDNYGNFTGTLKTDDGDTLRAKITTHLMLNPTGKVPYGVDWRTVGEHFDYGYAMTVHKAQGSEADRVFILGYGFGDVEQRNRWLYTAITRAKEECYICGDKI